MLAFFTFSDYYRHYRFRLNSHKILDLGILIDKYESLATDVSCTEDALRVVLADGREVAVPLA